MWASFLGYSMAISLIGPGPLTMSKKIWRWFGFGFARYQFAMVELGYFIVARSRKFFGFLSISRFLFSASSPLCKPYPSPWIRNLYLLSSWALEILCYFSFFHQVLFCREKSLFSPVFYFFSLLLSKFTLLFALEVTLFLPFLPNRLVHFKIFPMVGSSSWCPKLVWSRLSLSCSIFLFVRSSSSCNLYLHALNFSLDYLVHI